MSGFPPKKNAAYIFYSSLVDTANRPDFKDTPTIAAGDFKVSTDGGALGNLATLPAVTPASSVMVKFSLSAGEMNGDNITVVCIDAAGAEWDDLLFNIQTATRQIDDLAFPNTSGRGIDVEATGEVGVDFGNILGTLDAGDIGTDAIGSDELATSAVQEISRAVNPQVNTALNNITFEMYDSTNHNPSAGLTVTGERSLDGGAYAAVTGTITEISDGTYQLDASQADMNGALIVFRFSAGASDDTFVHIKTAA